MDTLLAFKQLDNYAHFVVVWKQFHSYQSLSAISAQNTKKRDHHKNSYKLFKLNKNCCFLPFLFFHQQHSTGGFFIVSIAQATNSTTHVFTEKPKKKGKKKKD